MKGIVGWILAAGLAAGLASCGPSGGMKHLTVGSGAGNVNTAFGYQPISMMIKNCTAENTGEILVRPSVLTIWNTEKVVWVVAGRTDDTRWTIVGKDTAKKYFNDGNEMKIDASSNLGVPDNAYFTDPPQNLPGSCTQANPCEWEYNVEVEKKISGSWVTCQVLDPKIKIRD